MKEQNQDVALLTVHGLLEASGIGCSSDSPQPVHQDDLFGPVHTTIIVSGRSRGCWLFGVLGSSDGGLTPEVWRSRWRRGRHRVSVPAWQASVWRGSASYSPGKPLCLGGPRGRCVSEPACVWRARVWRAGHHAQAALITALVSAVTHMRSAHYRGIEGRALAVTRSHRGSASYFSSLGGVCVAAENTVARRISTDAHKFCFTARSAVAHMALLTILSLVSRSNRASAH